MTPRCPQTLDNGQRCSALAINGSKYCRHHDPQRPPKPAREEPPESEPLLLPPLFDKPSILAALNEVVQALAGGRIKHSVADTLLYAIKLAARLVTELDEAGLSIHSEDEQPAGRHDEPALPHRDEFAQTRKTAAADPLRNQIAARQTARTTNREVQSHYSNGSVALAASGIGTNTFNPARRAGAPPLYPEQASSLDPSTARIVKDLLAETHQLANTQKAKS